MEGHPPWGRPSSTPAARSPHRACKPRGQCWAPAPAYPRPQHMGSGPRQHAQRAGSRGRGSARTQTPLTTVYGTPRGDAPRPPPQRATTARKGARCGTGAGSPLPHQPHPGHTGCGTPAARPRGRAAGGGGAPDTRRPSQRRKGPLWGMLFRQPHGAPRRLARARAVGPLLGPQAHTKRTRDTRVAELRLPAPEDERPGEGQHLTPDAPHKWGRPPPPGDGPLQRPRGTQHPTGHASRGDSACLAPTPAHPSPQHVGCGPRRPTRRAKSRGRGSA